MENCDILQKVEDAIRRYYNRPVPLNDIARAANLTNQTTLQALADLLEQGRIDKIHEGPRAYYQIHTEGKSKAERNLETRFAELDEALNDRIHTHEERIVQHEKRLMDVEKETSNIYVNIISIMGVFVAIFSLIVVNANAAFKIIAPNDEPKTILLKMLILNGPVVVGILVLLFGIRWIILSSRHRGDRK